jgi:hypothetical protein
MHTDESFINNGVKPKRKKLTDEERKEKQRAHAKAWYERNKTGKAKTKKQKPKVGKKKSSLNAEHSSHTFLFFVKGDEEHTVEVLAEDASERAMEIFSDSDYEGVEQIYFMKPLRLYNRPVMEITEL